MSKNSEAVERFRQRRRALVYEVLGSKCVRCGSTGPLEADHVDPATKSFNISAGLQKRLDVFLAELSKCQHLCSECHIKKTKDDGFRNECSYGHPLEGDNLVLTRSGYRRCRTCKNRNSRASKARVKERNRLDQEHGC